MEKKDKKINDYVVETKSDMFLYLIILVILIITAVILNVLYGEAVLYTFIAFVLFHLFFTFDKITSYRNILRIKKCLVNNNLENKIGNIIFWNEKNYFLTDNYVLIVKGLKVDCISYQDIKSISKRMDINFGKHSGAQEYLTIEVSSGKQYDILTWSTYLVGEEYKDISDILLEKNSKIDVIAIKKK